MKEVIKKEESELIKMVRENNPSFEDFKIVKRFKNNHIKTFREITLLIRVQRDEVEKFFYVFFIEARSNRALSYAGKQRVVQPKVNKDGKYTIPNRQRRVDTEKGQKAIEFINQEHPLTADEGSFVKKVILRKFPNLNRYIIVIRSNRLVMKFVVFEYKSEEKGIKIVDVEESQVKDKVPVSPAEKEITEAINEVAICTMESLIEEEEVEEEIEEEIEEVLE